MGKETMTFKTN